MAKKKTKSNVKNAAVTKTAAVRFSPKEYYKINVADENIKLIAEINGQETEYDVTGGGGYIEELLWENPEPTRGLKVKTLLTDNIALDDYEKFKIIYKKMNNHDEMLELTFTLSQMWDDGAQFGLVSTGDNVISEEYEAKYLYVRQLWYDGNMGGIMVDGACYELSAAHTDKNFRAVPIYLYGYKKEV